tara:strand:+ start:551 stop:841 length:291 start_codon:yes stop_codon:yes gene_type:complete
VELFKDLSTPAKIASVFFILGKLMFIPAVINIFTGNKTDAGMMISIYIMFIVLSIVISLYDIYLHKNIEIYDPTKDGIYNGEFKVLIKDGKIVKIL